MTPCLYAHRKPARQKSPSRAGERKGVGELENCKPAGPCTWIESSPLKPIPTRYLVKLLRETQIPQSVITGKLTKCLPCQSTSVLINSTLPPQEQKQLLNYWPTEATIYSSTHPSIHPSVQSFIHPSSHSASQPFTQPASHPSIRPFTHSSIHPSSHPSIQPLSQPASHPSTYAVPTVMPGPSPSESPSESP